MQKHYELIKENLNLSSDKTSNFDKKTSNNQCYCPIKLNNLMEKFGMNNRYQIISLAIIFSLYGTAEFIAIALPLMEINPYIIYFDTNLNRNVTEQINYDLCDNELKKFNYVIDLEKSRSSLVLDFNIFCSEGKVGLIGSSLFLGVMIGSFLSYYFSDRYGRKKTAILFSLIYSFNLIIFLFINNLIFLYFFLFTSGVIYSIIILSSILLLNEVIDVNLTAIFTTIIYNAYPVFGVFYSILFRDLNNWKLIFAIIGIIHLISTVFLWWMLEESPRFFFAKKNITSLQLSLINIGKVNKLNYPFALNSEEGFIQMLKKDEKDEEAFGFSEFDLKENYNNSNTKETLRNNLDLISIDESGIN